MTFPDAADPIDLLEAAYRETRRMGATHAVALAGVFYAAIHRGELPAESLDELEDLGRLASRLMPDHPVPETPTDFALAGWLVELTARLSRAN